MGLCVVTETTTTWLALAHCPNLSHVSLNFNIGRISYLSLRYRVLDTSLNSNPLLGKGNTLGYQQSANWFIKLALRGILALGKLIQEGCERKGLKFVRG